MAAAQAEVPVYPWLCTACSGPPEPGTMATSDVRPSVSMETRNGIWVNKTNTCETQTGERPEPLHSEF